jgi:hypothetical protein
MPTLSLTTNSHDCNHRSSGSYRTAPLPVNATHRQCYRTVLYAYCMVCRGAALLYEGNASCTNRKRVGGRDGSASAQRQWMTLVSLRAVQCSPTVFSTSPGSEVLRTCLVPPPPSTSSPRHNHYRHSSACKSISFPKITNTNTCTLRHHRSDCINNVSVLFVFRRDVVRV